MLPKKVSAKTFTYLLCTEHWWVEHDLLLQKWNLIKRDGSFHDSLFLERVVSASWPCRPNRVWPVCLTSGQLQILKAELLEAAENGWWMSREKEKQRKGTHIRTCMGRLTERKNRENGHTYVRAWADRYVDKNRLGNASSYLHWQTNLHVRLCANQTYRRIDRQTDWQLYRQTDWYIDR
jgi:hypothetical protein